MKKLAATAIIFFGLGFGFANRHDLIFWLQDTQSQKDIPEAVARVDIENTGPEIVVEDIETTTSTVKVVEDESEETATSTPELPKSEDIKPDAPIQFNLKIPFTSQAPHANWDMPYQEACEEASILMSLWFINGDEAKTKEEADAAILELVAWQEATFGYYKDTTVEETLHVMHDRFGLTDAYSIDDPTIEQIQNAIALGYPVIVPAAGRHLDNPNFTGEGPLYHMLVIRGYTETEFITNDPGTRRGEQFRYNKEHLMSVIHDWNGGDVDNGKRAVIIAKN